MKQWTYLVSAVFVGVFSATAAGRTVSIDLPGLIGPIPYPGGKTEAFDFGRSFEAIADVRFRCSGTITPGLGCGDGVERPVFPYFDWPAQIEAYMDSDPGFWTVFIGPYDGSFTEEESFKKHFGANWDLLLDGQGELRLNLAHAIMIGGHRLEAASASITEAELIVEVSGPKVLSPNGGEFLPGEIEYEIKWSDCGGCEVCPHSYVVEYSTDGGAEWSAVTPGSVSNTCSYTWSVPVLDSNQCVVRVTDASDPNCGDASDNSFHIYECREVYWDDLNGDCYMDFLDFCILAEGWTGSADDFYDLSDLVEDWSSCGNPYDPLCGQ